MLTRITQFKLSNNASNCSICNLKFDSGYDITNTTHDEELNERSSSKHEFICAGCRVDIESKIDKIINI